MMLVQHIWWLLWFCVCVCVLGVQNEPWMWYHGGLKILMRSWCWSLKVRIGTRLFTDWLHLPAWGGFASQTVLFTFFVGNLQFQMRMVEFRNSEERRGPGPKFQGETSKNTHSPSQKKWRAQVFILKPLSTTFQNMSSIIIFNWWHQGHPVRASGHWTKGSNLVILFCLFNSLRWYIFF